MQTKRAPVLRAGTHLLAYIRSRTSIARRAIARDTTTYMHAPSVYTFAVIGYRLYRVQQPYGAQTRQLGMWVTYRNRALSNPILPHRTPEFCVSPPRSSARYLRFRPFFFSFFFLFFLFSFSVKRDVHLSPSFHLAFFSSPPTPGNHDFDVVIQIIRHGYLAS
ncbi:hypothetical protein PUN28_018045 [Cardiocondyla obscurior]|uniref:Uncharacterized protein n=1 Tax=Cardiocondyla obscurior TaxID=286306 RepID=A0AAW2EI91_9HYME